MIGICSGTHIVNQGVELKRPASHQTLSKP
jgi:hypothetical protein